MATWEDVLEIAAQLEGVEGSTMYGEPALKVGGRGFVWVRPLRKKDLEELDLDGQPEIVIGAFTGDVGEQLALIDENPDVFFKTTHIEGYPIAFVWLERIDHDRLAELVRDAHESRRSA